MLLNYQNKNIKEDEFIWLEQEIAKAENRLTSDGFYRGNVLVEGTLYDNRSEHPTKEYIGYVLDFDETTNVALIEQRNYFELNDLVEFFGPNLENTRFVVDNLYSVDQKENIEVARHPLEKLYIKLPFKVHKHDMLRKVK